MTKPKKRGKPVKLWGGFVNGRLDRTGVYNAFYMCARNDEWSKSAAVFPNRETARQQYEDVRRIEIREVAK